MKVTEEIAKKTLTELIKLLEKTDDFSLDNLKEKIIALVEKLELKNGQVLWPMRACLTGEKYSPGAFEVASVLGKEETVRRLNVGLTKLW